MANPNSKEPLGVVAREFHTVYLAAGFLTVFQLILGWIFGSGGVKTAFGLYLGVSYASDNLNYTSQDGLVWRKSDEESSTDYWTRVAWDIIIMLIQMLIWALVGSLFGKFLSRAEMQSPAVVLKKFAKQSFFFRIILAYLAHVSLFAFWRIWVNMYDAFKAMSREGGTGSNKKK